MLGDKWEQLGADMMIAVVHQICWSERGRRLMKQPTASTTTTIIAHPIFVATFLLVAITFMVSSCSTMYNLILGSGGWSDTWGLVHTVKEK